MLALKELLCEPCNGNEEPLENEQTEILLQRLKSNWKVIDNKKIKCNFPFDDFKSSINFVNEVARIAENQDHHPDLCIHYNSVELSTHALNGLSENDFIMAAKIDDILMN